MNIPKKIKIVCVRSVAAGPLRRPYPLPLWAVWARPPAVSTQHAARQAAARQAAARQSAGGRRQAAARQAGGSQAVCRRLGSARQSVTHCYMLICGHFGQRPRNPTIRSVVWRGVRWRASMGTVGTLGTFQGTHHIAPTAHYIPPYEIQISKPENTDRHPNDPHGGVNSQFAPPKPRPPRHPPTPIIFGFVPSGFL